MAILSISRGLVTQPSELTRPDGALEIADNCVIDSDNVIEPRRGFSDFGNTTSTNDDVKQLLTYKGRILRHFSDKLSFDSDGNGTFLNFSGSYTELITKLRIKYFEANSNLYFTTNQGVKKISARTADDFTTDANFITNAGGIKAIGLQAKLKPSVAGWLPAQSKVAYKLLWAIKDNNGNVIRGVPSSKVTITNNSKDINLGEKFNIVVKDAGAGIHKEFDSTASVAGAVITISNHGFTAGTKVRFFGTIPKELNKNTDYFVVNVTSSNVFGVSLTSGGTAITLTDAVGTGFVYSGINNSNFFTFDTPTNKFACWFNISGEDIAPTDTLLVGRYLREVPIYTLSQYTKEKYTAKIAETLFNITDIEVVAESSKITVTNIDSDNVADASNGNIDVNFLEVSKIYDGQTAIGTPANVELSFDVPSEITSTQYFYELYRTSYVTVDVGLTLEEISPDEEFQKVYEAPITNNGSIPTSITIEDITPETFRAGGPYLYTNPISGEGVTQANEAPPIAQDVAFFKGSAFYANTKERHRTQFNLLSVSDFTPGTSKFYVGNSTVFREYVFVGAAEATNFTVLPKSQTVGNSYVLINSAKDSIKYKIWFDKGIIQHSFDATTQVSGVTISTTLDHGFANGDAVKFSGTIAPELNTTSTYYVVNRTNNTFQVSTTVGGTSISLTDAIGTSTVTHTPVEPVIADTYSLRVALQTYDDTLQGSVDSFKEAFFDIVDFTVEDMTGGVVKVSCNDNGDVTDPTHSSPASGWTFSVITQGIGEDASMGEVLLSGLSSVGQSVEDTARSLERIINKDALSPVNAFYLSGTEDLPGKLLLESRSLLDDPFYVGVNESVISSKFSPEMPSSFTITDITISGNIFTTSTNHGFIPGQQVYVFDNPSGSKVQFGGKYVVATTPALNTFTLSGVTVTADQLAITGVVFKADVASDNSVNPNRVYFSKLYQPEAVPLVNYVDIGPKDKAIQRILALKDSLIVLKEDGVYVISGSAAPNFFVRLVDSSSLILAPDTAVTLNNLIYVLSTQGVVTVSDTGVGVISRNIENKIQEVTNAKFDYKLTSWGVASESDRAYFIWLPTKTADSKATQAFRYNTFTRTWTRWTKPATCGVVNPNDDKIYLGDGSGRPYVLKERKNFEREDYSDGQFNRLVGSNAVINNTIALNSTVGVEVGDVITQVQYLDINKFNRFLKKLDRDSLISNDYYSSLHVTTGDSMGTALLAVCNKLIADGIAVPVSSGSDVVTTVRNEFNAIANYLNTPGSGTGYKDYNTVSDVLTYEALITAVNQNTNTLTLKFMTEFLIGEITIFKGIACKVQYAPQHFGKPEATKQIAEGTFIFDQNNFWGGTVAYSSDRSYDFASIDFSTKGPGYWGGYNWANVTFGGLGNEVPVRTLIPRDKSRCRYIHVQFTHINAREKWRLLGVSLEPREVSTRGYR